MIAPLIEALTGLRCAAGFAQEVVAAHVGVSHTTVWKWEKGTAKPSRARLVAWCELFDHQATEEEMAAATYVAAEPVQGAVRTSRPAVGAWGEHAECYGMDNALFFAGPSDMDAERRAKAICRRCPVEAECLDWALAWGAEQRGIAGGKTAEERRAYRRQMNRRVVQAEAS